MSRISDGFAGCPSCPSNALCFGTTKVVNQYFGAYQKSSGKCQIKHLPLFYIHPGLAAKPKIEFVVITTLFAPDEQWMTKIFPFSSFPATIPTWDKSDKKARSSGCALSHEIRVHFAICPCVPCPICDAEKPELMYAHVTKPEQSSPKGRFVPVDLLPAAVTTLSFPHSLSQPISKAGLPQIISAAAIAATQAARGPRS